MIDYTEDWKKLTTRWRRGRKLVLFHLLAVPFFIYGFSFPVKRFAPNTWLISGEPVWYYLGCFAVWLAVFIHLLWRDRYYTCPQCGTNVRPFGGTDLPNLNPHPCPKCGLVAPSPPY